MENTVSGGICFLSTFDLNPFLGDTVDVFYATGVSETPLEMCNNHFSGFRVAAEYK